MLPVRGPNSGRAAGSRSRIRTSIYTPENEQPAEKSTNRHLAEPAPYIATTWIMLCGIDCGDCSALA